jgi:phenylpropionate dioxygenase-like ring-hydroxylating dioxygenase large terminal subunit
MFTNQHHLRHVLRPDQYVSEEQYRAELRHLFLPAWHPLATVDDLAKSGNFLTFELFETPILLRNFGGELRAFLNVCPHRHSLLVAEAGGNAENLKCRYHGWEYGADGRTRHIPDARAFRPWDRENSCLRPFRLDACGDIVFVNLSDNGISLRDWLGKAWDSFRGAGGAYRHAATWERDFPCNWKVVLENSLESYHIPQVHPKTFGDYAPEENVWHELTERYTSFKTIPPNDLAARAMRWLVRRLGRPVTGEYRHWVLHPHTTGSSLDVFRMVQCVFPTGPTTCRYRTMFFTLRGDRCGPLAWVLARFLRWFATKVARKVFDEDAAVYHGIQRGMEASPHRGVIGTREERVFAFQQYVSSECNGARELPQIAVSPAKHFSAPAPTPV